MSYGTVSQEVISSTGQKQDAVRYLVDLVNFSDISSIKSTVNGIIRVINDPRSTVKELKEVILLDPPLAGKVLKTANSAYYSRSFTRTYTDIEQAIIWMGSDIIKELALSQKVCEIFDRDEEIEDYSRKSLWRHSIATAMLAKMIYRKEFGLRGENAYVAGLLHDIGIIAEDQFLQEDFKRVLQLSRAKNIDMAKAEFELWSYDHADVAKSITESWMLPKELVTTISCHHRPLDEVGEFFRITAVLYTADYFCQQRGFAFGAAPPNEERILGQCLEIIEVKSYALDMIGKSMMAEMTKMEDKGLI
ncbi:MAG: HDOD domain-containing protein [bacterium]|nr:HDOD domain-containing protein [bacterium]